MLEPGPLVLIRSIWRILHSSNSSSNPFQLLHVSDHRGEVKRRTQKAKIRKYGQEKEKREERRVFDEKEERKRYGQEIIKGKNKCRERDKRKINKKRERERERETGRFSLSCFLCENSDRDKENPKKPT